MIWCLWQVGEVVKDIAIGARGLGFDSLAGQIGHSVASGSSPLRLFFGPVLSRRLAAEMGHAISCTLWRNIASTIKIRF